MSRFSKNQKITLAAVGSLMIIIILGIVYAAFTQQLSINGSATGRSSTWRVYFSSLSNVSLTGTAKELTAPEIDSNNQTSIGNYSVSVTSPGDSVEYTFDVTNSGDYDATLTGLNKTNPTCTGDGANASTDATNVCGKLTYTLKYADGTTVAQNDTLKSKETKTMKLKLTYNTFDDASLLPKADVAITGLGITLTYSQDGNAKVNSDGSTPLITYTAYSVGDTFTINGDSYHVIAASGINQDYVVALKDNVLTVTEVNQAGGTANDNIGSGTVGGIYFDSLSNTYDTSDIKNVVDTWASSKFINNELKTVDGYSVRLMKFSDLATIGYRSNGHSSPYWDTPQWACGYMESSWTMERSSSPFGPVTDEVYLVPNCYFEPSHGEWTGTPENVKINDRYGAVRPVINVYKSKISS